MEKELKELKENTHEQPAPTAQSSEISGANSLSQSMSQVSLKAIEITGLNTQNRDLMDMASVREELKKKLEERCKELEGKNNELTNQVSGQEALIGEKHLILDMIIVEETNLRAYLDFIHDKESATQAAKKNI